MTRALIRPELLYAWHGQSLLIVNHQGDCGPDQPVSGYYFRETRFLRTLRLEIDGQPPWRCEAAEEDHPDALRFNYVHPEVAPFSHDDVKTDAHGIPHRALDVDLRYQVLLAGLDVTVEVANRAGRAVEFEIAWALAADYADIQEALYGTREQEASIDVTSVADAVRFTYEHPALPYRTHARVSGAGAWTASGPRLAAKLRLHSQEVASLRLRIEPEDYRSALSGDDVARRERRWRSWRDSFARVATPGNTFAEDVIRGNLRDFASFPLLDGADDEWLALQAGMPVYPALFGRDTLTAGWQTAFVDRGASLAASLTRLGRMQSDRVDDWHDEEPGRIPYQVRQGPLARLDLNPYAAYYADFASPLMFVISLAHLYAWTGEKADVARHWDTARRILDWAREYGDRDRDGYLEYLTRSSKGTKNQGWKDSDNAILYEDGSPVPPPIATCELQGYWFAAQQVMAVLSWVQGERETARAYWRAAMELKERFNRDWWIDAEHCVALAMDPEKRLVRAVTSNAGHCLATGIVADEHLPALVGRLFAPDMFSGWGVRTLSTSDRLYNPLEYHRGTVWAVENATILFGLRRFGFDTRALELARALFDLAKLYAGYRIPECVGGYARGERPVPGAYPRATAPQLWNASGVGLVVHSLLGLQPVAPLNLLVVDPALPAWLPEVVIHDLKLAATTATIRFWRDERGVGHAEVLRKRGTLRLLKQPPVESLSAGVGDRFRALVDSVLPHWT